MIDLHTHSLASDGTISPGELPQLAAESGLSAVALTDHDTVAGIAEFLSAGEKTSQLAVIPGVELSTNYSGKEIHIIGLFIDHKNETLLNFLELQRQERARRNEEIRRKLTFLGYPVSWSEPEFAAFSDTSSIGRPHFARVLCRKFGIPDKQQAFQQLLGQGRPAYVRRRNPDPVKAIAAIHAAGGLAVWAHPVSRNSGEWAFVRRFCRKFAALGLDAMECYYSAFGPEETKNLLEIARQAGLGVSGGSDFHGDNSRDIALGRGTGTLAIPDEVCFDLVRRHREKQYK